MCVFVQIIHKKAHILKSGGLEVSKTKQKTLSLLIMATCYIKKMFKLSIKKTLRDLKCFNLSRKW